MPIKVMFGSLILLLLTGSFASAQAPQFDARVDPDDPAAFASIASAIAAAPEHSLAPYQIAIAAGDYYEKLVVEKPNVQLIGAGQALTRIYHDTYAGLRKSGTDETWGTSGSGTLIVRATDFVARDLHIENSFDFPANELLPQGDPNKLAGTQAVAVKLDTGSDRALFDRVTLSGYQDTLYAASGRSLYRQSTIKGHVDFIFGAGTAVFVDSDIVTRARYQPMPTIGYISAPSTKISTPFGLVFINSRLLREAGVADNSMALGRPWHPTTTFADGRYADPDAIGQAVYINCWMDAHIQQQPWHPMAGSTRDGSRIQFQPQDARFFEFANRGPGARHSPGRRQLSITEAQQFTQDNLLGDWQPPPATDTRPLVKKLDGEMPDFSIARAFNDLHQEFPDIKPIVDTESGSIGAHRNLVYRELEGRQLHLDLFQPKAVAKAAPAVVLIHGGGWRTGDRSHQVPMAQALAEAGYVGVAVEYRLSREALYPAGLHDIQAAIRWLRRHSDRYGIDPEHIAILGASSGAHMATLIGSVGHLPQFAGEPNIQNGVSSRVQAIVNLDGVVDLESAAARTFEDKPGKISYMALWLGGRYHELPGLWQEVSPLQYAGEYTPPTLFVNSSHDRFHVGRDEFVSRLGEFGTYTEIHTIPDTPHPFWLFHPWFDSTRDLVIGFLDRTFRGQPGH